MELGPYGIIYSRSKSRSVEYGSEHACLTFIAFIAFIASIATACYEIRNRIRLSGERSHFSAGTGAKFRSASRAPGGKE